MPSRSACSVISSLSIPTSGRNTGICDAVSITAMLSSVCDATWPIDVAGHERAGADVARNALGDAQHHPPVHDHAKSPGTLSVICRCSSPNGIRYRRVRNW